MLEISKERLFCWGTNACGRWLGRNNVFSKKGHVRKSRDRFGWGILPRRDKAVGASSRGGGGQIQSPRSDSRTEVRFKDRGQIWGTRGVYLGRGDSQN